MAKAIAYDKSVLNLIDELDATGHVSHRSYKKKSVTLHHNGGRLSHQGVLNVWKVRPASAHFNIDGKGTCAQYVRVNEYAWATGNTRGNQETISIEMANATTAPEWKVADVTWKSAARLAGWLFAKVIGERPSKNNLFYHHHWSATACAGPWMDKQYSKVLAEAQKAYDSFKGNKSPAPSSKPTPSASKSLTQISAEVWAGKWGTGEDRNKRLTAAGYNAKQVQDLVNKGVGKTRPASSAAPQKSIAEVAKDVIAGKWGDGKERRKKLFAAGYNATSVQTEVNRQLSGPKSRKSINKLAAEVIAGEWGDGAERQRRLTKAGYSYKTVQAEVNRRL